jgi:hypothetical protein
MAVMMSLLDWNGSVTIMECSLLERMVSHTLSREEYRLIHDADMAAAGDQDPPVPFDLVTTLVDRSRSMKCFLKRHSGKNHPLLPHCLNAPWLARAHDPADPWLVLLLASSSSSAAGQDNSCHDFVWVFTTN